MRRLALAAALAASTTVAPAIAAATAAQEVQQLSVCFAENDPPRSLRAGAQGFDVDVARLLARHLQRNLRIVWVAERYQTDIESTDVDYRPILTGQCDAQLSVPGADAVARFRGRLVLSEPYYGAAFELLPASSAFRWKEPYAGVVAVRANSVAHVAIDALGARWTMQAETAGILAALRTGAATSALVWGPDLATLDIGRNDGFEPPPVLRWNLHATTRRDDPLLAALNRAFADEAVQAALLALMRQHRFPAHAPFETTHTRASMQALLAP